MSWSIRYILLILTTTCKIYCEYPQSFSPDWSLSIWRSIFLRAITLTSEDSKWSCLRWWYLRRATATKSHIIMFCHYDRTRIGFYHCTLSLSSWCGCTEIPFLCLVSHYWRFLTWFLAKLQNGSRLLNPRRSDLSLPKPLANDIDSVSICVHPIGEVDIRLPKRTRH